MARKPSLLIVDDDRDICEMLMFACGDAFEVQCAYGGTEAMQRLRGHRYDAVLVDLVLPGISGSDIAMVASSQGAGVVMMTGYAVEDLVGCPFCGGSETVPCYGDRLVRP